jgi:hypothetical protein
MAKRLAIISNGSKETFDIQPGRHSICVGWWGGWPKSKNIESSFSAGETRIFECGVNSMMIWLWMAVIVPWRLFIILGPFANSGLRIRTAVDMGIGCILFAIMAPYRDRWYYLKETQEGSSLLPHKE